MTYALGIDLGTTYTAAAVARGGRAEVVALGYRATSVPTVVFLADDGRFLVGDAAERRAGTAPDRVAREFKRRVGDATPLLLGGSPIAVDRCLAEVLEWVVATIAETEGRPPAAVTVTHPANWGEFKQDVLREALRLADVPSPRLLPEPVAAATWYAQAQRLAPGQTVAVYDLGGGTFDAAVLRRRPDGGFETVGRTEGIERLGGVDIDQAVMGHVLRTLGGRAAGLADAAGDAVDPDGDDPATVIAMAQLREACVEAKEALSSETSVTIPVWLPGLHHQVLLRRTELEDLVGPMLRPTVDALARVVASAGMRPNDLHAVLLVGGSSRIPLIARQVSAAFGRPIAVDAHPKHPVALGAAIDAAANMPAPGSGGPGGPGGAPFTTAVAGGSPVDPATGRPVGAGAGAPGGVAGAGALAGPSGAGAVVPAGFGGRGDGAALAGTGPAVAGGPGGGAGVASPAPGGNGAPPYGMAGAPGSTLPGTQPRAPWLAGPAGARPDAPPVRPSWPTGPRGGVQDAPPSGSLRPGLPPLGPPPATSANPSWGYRMAWIFSILGTLLVISVSLFFVFRNQANLAAGTGTTPGASTGPSATPAPGAAATGTPSGGETGGPVDLFANPQPAFDAFATLHGGAPEVAEVTIYDTWALASVRVPDQPTYFDDYQYENGALTGPEETLIPPDADEAEAAVFSLTDINPSIIPTLLPRTCQGDGYQVSHIIIERDMAFDDQQQVRMLVYASHPDRRSTGGYVKFALDGTEIQRYCE